MEELIKLGEKLEELDQYLKNEIKKFQQLIEEMEKRHESTSKN